MSRNIGLAFFDTVSIGIVFVVTYILIEHH